MPEVVSYCVHSVPGRAFDPDPRGLSGEKQFSAGDGRGDSSDPGELYSAATASD